MEQNQLQITRKGQWPVLLYEVREPRVFCASVFIEDSKGTILIDTDMGQQDCYSHWWGGTARGTPTLREFLVTTNSGYLLDKFSYGKTRWSIDKAEADYTKFINEKITDEAERERYEWSMYDFGDARTANELYHMMHEESDVYELVQEEFWEGNGFGQTYGNPDTEHMLKRVLMPLIEFWKTELQTEKGEARVLPAT
jgi:hypothetical protein